MDEIRHLLFAKRTTMDFCYSLLVHILFFCTKFKVSANDNATAFSKILTQKMVKKKRIFNWLKVISKVFFFSRNNRTQI